MCEQFRLTVIYFTDTESRFLQDESDAAPSNSGRKKSLFARQAEKQKKTASLNASSNVVSESLSGGYRFSAIFKQDVFLRYKWPQCSMVANDSSVI